MNDKDSLKAKLAERPVTGGEGFMTSNEIAREMGWTLRRTMKRLHELKEAGELEAEMVQRANLANRLSTIPGYRLKSTDKSNELG